MTCNASRKALVLILFWLFSATLWAQTDDSLYIRQNFTKREFYIPMRDGVRLFTSLYIPKDSSKKYPIILNRTPYSVAPYGEENYRTTLLPSELLREGYIFAYQDVRGRWMSEGEFVNVRPNIPGNTGNQIDESSDTYDTIEWLVKNVSLCNGKVGIWGISYPGFYAAASLPDAHPALKAVSPQAPVTDWWIGDDFHHNGAFFLMDAFTFLYSFGKARPKPTTVGNPPYNFPTPDAYKFYLELGALRNVNEKIYRDSIAFWNEMMNHPNYDEFWKSRTILPHLKNITPAVMTVGGWFDAEDLYGPLKVYDAIERQNPKARNILVMGPWYHGAWARTDGDRLGYIKFGSKTGQFYREHILKPFFNAHLKGNGNDTLPEAILYDVGRDQWRTFETWHPKNVVEKNLYFHANGKLSFEPPKDTKGYDEYISDPNKPVPYTNEIRIDRSVEYMIEDQRFAARRPDVLVYQTDVLTEDITLAGNIFANLFASTTGSDADFIVKLIDVFPDTARDEYTDKPIGRRVFPAPVRLGGYQMLVRWEVMRARYRKSYEKPEPMKPNQIEEVKFELQDVLHTFKKGHRIMVQVQSSMFPLIDRNPQKFVDIYKCSDSDFQVATHRIYRTAKAPSHLKVKILPQ
ncbi:MAG: CocE/NonD family hydrolase [Chloroherpetonaceae bacterium]|nr:CocE/NonD family hydrolase [Chloroherpetonaceae bacterium]MCS7210654.1 CocE/NonD family hydrolase [Chloroherpetonaceae bacterium]MDW8020919.1 CocE/NonD family hydrolase [Chloroherpetonaceae bacterium]